MFYAPAFTNMHEGIPIFDISSQPRPRRFASNPLMPRDFFDFAVLGPLEEHPRCGGDMCQRHAQGLNRLLLRNGNQEEKEKGDKSVVEEPWETTVKMEGFAPKDFTIARHGRNLIVNATQSKGDEESGVISKNFRRRITLPDYFILPSLDVNFKDNNIVLSGRRFVIKKDAEVAVENQTSEAAQGIVQEGKAEKSREVKVCTQDQQVSQKDAASESSEISEYKPVTWSIPLNAFEPNDVSVRLEDGIVRVVAEHEEENDGMKFFRTMERSFTLPPNVDPDTMTSCFCSDDGKLTIQVMPEKRGDKK